ncbi:hypothetical protein ONZ51_g11830 [Trametes cubensis]|uniref:CCHC-type domain-containing protein n=1 Tax=Trametes cubensis TaxID=1111947 RepID=A0AAD7X7G7_9APHY|nr:hypothetical protein ONZ51_g11830 [Trametes cubensis]
MNSAVHCYNSCCQLDDDAAQPHCDDSPFFTPETAHAHEYDGQAGLEERAVHYINSDEPLKLWIPRRDVYLDELLRHDGRGSYTRALCPMCLDEAPAVIRCEDCSPGPLLCPGCCVRAHIRCPFHRVPRWEGRAYRKTSLKELGLVIQLGHEGELGGCSNPIPRASFTVVDISGRHTVPVNFCGCDRAGDAGDHVQQLLRYKLYPATDIDPNTAFTFPLLQHYHIQSLQGKISMYDYYTSVERLTDNTGTAKCNDRYKGFMRVVAQWQHLKRLKFLYVMAIAIDACFRLQRRVVSSEEKDPILGSGWGYFVEDTEFKAVLSEYGDQEEMSNCVGLSAIDHANTKFSKGYAATGIGAVVCARHEFWLANGAGDLQKGERYINMDYVFVSSMREWLIVKKIVSYDIACQWSRHIEERIAMLPSHLQIPVPEGSITYVIPKLHHRSHEQKDHAQYSLNLRPGCARTDGEGIERHWWWIQPIANSTKVMGPGMRQGVLEDQWGYSNWRKTVDLVWTLSSRLKDAIRQLAEHKTLFDDLTQTLDRARCAEWEEMAQKWEVDPSLHDDPYLIANQGLTVSETVQELSREEQKASATPGFIAVHNVSMLGFINLGLEIETQQSHIADNARSAPPSKLAELHERRTSLRRKIQRFRDLQGVYMPTALPVLSENAACRTDVEEVEKIRLGLPSEINESRRAIVCSARLVEMEARLREAQCRDALQDLRNKLHTIRQLYNYKHLNDVRKERAVQRYRRARQAKLALSGAGDWEHELRVLKDHHIRGIEDDDPRAVAKRKRKRGDDPGPAEGHRRISWIWHAADQDGSAEEVSLLPEEMRRVLATYSYEQRRWTARIAARPSASSALREGLVSYAVKQAAIRSAMSNVFRRICLPVASGSSPTVCRDWILEDCGEDSAEVAAEEEGDDLKDFLILYHLDGQGKGKIKDPEVFNGDRDKTRSFLNQLFLLFTARPHDSVNDYTKVATALSFMEGDNINYWKGIHNSAVFKRNFLLAFAPVDKVDDSMVNLMTIKLKDYSSVNEFNARFMDLALKGKILDPAAQLALYKNALPEYLLKKISMLYPPLTSIREWMTRTKEVDHSYHLTEKILANCRGCKAKTSKTRKNVKMVNVKDDSLDTNKLSVKERQELQDKGSCFRCRKPGHISRDCPSKPKKPSKPVSWKVQQVTDKDLEDESEEISDEEDDKEEEDNNSINALRAMNFEMGF